MRKEENISYLIDIKGFSHGKQRFEFPLDMIFFDSMGNNRLTDTEDMIAVIEVERSGSRTEMTLKISGDVIVECDRCLNEIAIPMDIDNRIEVKFAEGLDETDDDNSIIVDRNMGEIDMSQLIYDTVMLSVPMVNYHVDGECNEDIVNKLNEKRTDEEKTTPFSNLKDLMNKNS